MRDIWLIKQYLADKKILLTVYVKSLIQIINIEIICEINKLFLLNHDWID